MHTSLLPNSFITPRLSLHLLTETDDSFIFSLVNTPGWLNFIGDRNVRSISDARAYIQKIHANENIKYWVVRVNEHLIPAGIITYIKREYLAYHDIGFAFLPAYHNLGYAFEAAKAVITYLSGHSQEPVLATTIKNNVSSIRLLSKCGFILQSEIVVDGRSLLVYGLPQ